MKSNERKRKRGGRARGGQLREKRGKRLEKYGKKEEARGAERGGLRRRHWERIGTYLFTVERDMR